MCKQRERTKLTDNKLFRKYDYKKKSHDQSLLKLIEWLYVLIYNESEMTLNRWLHLWNTIKSLKSKLWEFSMERWHNLECRVFFFLMSYVCLDCLFWGTALFHQRILSNNCKKPYVLNYSDTVYQCYSLREWTNNKLINKCTTQAPDSILLKIVLCNFLNVCQEVI